MTGDAPTQCRRTNKRAGFTLIELMMVVVIIGVLSALAIPAYTGYTHRARASDGVQFLQGIGVRQESFYAEFGTYAPVQGFGYSTDWVSNRALFLPNASSLDHNGVTWPAGTTAFAATLGLRPTGRTYLAYACLAGDPTDVPGGLGMSPDHWWAAAALADLNGDGTYLTIELTSQSRAPWMSSAKGWE